MEKIAVELEKKKKEDEEKEKIKKQVGSCAVTTVSHSPQNSK